MILKEKLKKYFSLILHHAHIMKFPILILYLIISLRLNAQAGHFDIYKHEKVYVHLNKLVYVAGESMRYKVYVVDLATPDQKPCSKILYFTLTGIKDKNVVNWRINLDDNPELSYFKIPGDIKPGMYILNAYTNWMRNDPSDIFSQNLLILSLSQATPNALMVTGSADTTIIRPVSPVHNDYALKVRTAKNSFAVNEKVQMEVSMSSGHLDTVKANLSISVSIKTPFNEILEDKDIESSLHVSSGPGGQPTASDKVEMVKRDVNVAPKIHMMEDKAFALSGRIKNRKDSSLLVNGQILVSVIDTVAPHIIYSHTDSSGRFLIYISKLCDNKELYLQIVGQSRNTDYIWEFDNKMFDPGHQIFKPYIVKSDEIAFLNSVNNMRLVEAVYANPPKRNSVMPFLTGENFFSPPDLTVFPSDYVDLVNFKEIAENIVPLIKFTMRNNEYNLQIINSKSSNWFESKTLLLNGVPFTDLAYLATLGTKDIRRIEVITTNFFIGEMTRPALLSIYTTDGKVPELYIKNNTVVYKNTVITNGIGAEFNSVDSTSMSREHLPDFRNDLYWNPDVTISNKKNLLIEFPASLLTGLFTIKIQGLTLDGFPVSATASFEVKE